MSNSRFEEAIKIKSLRFKDERMEEVFQRERHERATKQFCKFMFFVILPSAGMIAYSIYLEIYKKDEINEEMRMINKFRIIWISTLIFINFLEYLFMKLFKCYKLRGIIYMYFVYLLLAIDPRDKCPFSAVFGIWYGYMTLTLGQYIVHNWIFASSITISGCITFLTIKGLKYGLQCGNLFPTI